MRVFLSSTYQDLIAHRAAVTDALERLGQQVGRMEVFGARPAEPVTACLDDIEVSDLFVGVYAHRYGFIPGGSRVSITELEYDHAKAQGKPLFCFIVGENCEWPADSIEGEPGSSMLRAFKDRLQASLVVDFFNEPLDLAVRVATVVGRHLIQHPSLTAVPPANSKERNQREALISLLEAKKEEVLELLKDNKAARERFLQLHALNVEAINNGELLLSYLLTVDIHSLLYGKTLVKAYQIKHAKALSLLDHIIEEGKLRQASRSPLPLSSRFASLYPLTAVPEDARVKLYWAATFSLRVLQRSRNVKGEQAYTNFREAREQLLLAWLRSEVKPLEAKLSDQRRIAALVREAAARDVLPAPVGIKGKVVCPHCGRRFNTQEQAGAHQRCPDCLTHIILTEQEPQEFMGHLIFDDQCLRCGGSKGAIEAFGFKCA